MIQKIKQLLPKAKKQKILLLSLTSFIFTFFMAGLAYAQGAFQQPISKPILIMIAMASLALIPMVIMMITCFVKIAVVLALIRNAMGTQQIPPNQIITGLAIILTIYIMTPVGIEVYRNTTSVIETTTNQGFLSQATVGLLKEGFEKGKEPVKQFLVKHAHDKERVLFYSLAVKMRQPQDRDSVKNDDFLILIPAFIISELSEAFQIGFVIFLPFLVIDMVVANILLALGMFQLSPVTVSLPFKLLLFVLVDGWYLIAKGLILGYV